MGQLKHIMILRDVFEREYFYFGAVVVFSFFEFAWQQLLEHSEKTHSRDAKRGKKRNFHFLVWESSAARVARAESSIRNFVSEIEFLKFIALQSKHTEKKKTQRDTETDTEEIDCD